MITISLESQYCFARIFQKQNYSSKFKKSIIVYKIT
jgi:hypothetical protein